MKEIKYLIKQDNKNIENYNQKQITNNNIFLYMKIIQIEI